MVSSFIQLKWKHTPPALKAKKNKKQKAKKSKKTKKQKKQTNKAILCNIS